MHKFFMALAVASTVVVPASSFLPSVPHSTIAAPAQRHLVGTASTSWTAHRIPLGRSLVRARATVESNAEPSAAALDDDEDNDHVINLTPSAVEHLTEMRRKLEVAESDPLLIRMGVRSGGCSGMSYVMDICQPSDVTEDDHEEDWPFEKLRCVIDPKSLLYLFGMQLDYSNELIGGGFGFSNPNAETTCGCGKSFNV